MATQSNTPLPWREHAELMKRLAESAPSQFDREQCMTFEAREHSEATEVL